MPGADLISEITGDHQRSRIGPYVVKLDTAAAAAMHRMRLKSESVQNILAVHFDGLYDHRS